MAKRTVYVAGHKGMVGSALLRQLASRNDCEVLVADKNQLDLTNQQAVRKFFDQHKIDEIYLAAAKVGGIHANNEYPAEFIYRNLMIEANVIHTAHEHDIQKLLFLGSSCIYPKLAEQPMSEDALLSGALECTNEPYAIAKIAGIKLCESYNRQYGRDYRSVMPTNLYGSNDNFHIENAHVIPALMRRFHEAKLIGASSVMVWGTGNAMREFLYVDDMAEASIFVMNLDKCVYEQSTQEMLSHINVGTGTDFTISELTEVLVKVVGFKGEVKWDTDKPDGAPRKLLDVSRLQRLGWRAKTDLESGLARTYDWFLENQRDFRA